MLLELRVHNFRTLINSTFRFKRQHLLIGRNNSGKTNLCYVFPFLRETAYMDIGDAVARMPGGSWDFCNYALQDRDRVASFALVAELMHDEGPYRFEYELQVSIGDPRRVAGQAPGARVVSEKLSVTGGPFSATPLIANDGEEVDILDEAEFRKSGTEVYESIPSPPKSTMLAKIYERDTNPVAITFRQFLLGIAYYNLSSQRIREGWRDAQGSEVLEGWGANLAQVIYSLKTAQEGRYRNILDRVRRFERRLVAFNFLVSPDQNIVPIVELEGGRIASWGSLSDGTLRALAIAYLIECARTDPVNPPTSPVLIIEEPERGLFVGELRELLDDVESACPDAQFIFTSHSPYFIELFDDDLDAVTLLKREPWHTTSTTLEDRRTEIETALETMSLGEQYFREMLG